MSEQTFEIRCPRCGSVVPPEAPSCPGCTETRVEASRAEAPRIAPPQLATMRLKDYHHLVRANYLAVEGPRVSGRAAGVRVRAYLPFLLLLVGLLVGAALAFGRL